MELVKPSFEVEGYVNGFDILASIEKAGRTCYKSEEKITVDSSKNFVKSIIKSGHESVIEHEKITVRIICDRGVTHEIVRHRIASYSQESTRYCNYKSKGLTVIEPFFFINDEKKYGVWKEVMAFCEKKYNELIEMGAIPQEARSVLPNSLKTEIVVTYNLREWRHFFYLRCSLKAHPQIREISVPILMEFKKKIPVIFDDFVIDEEKMTAHIEKLI